MSAESDALREFIERETGQSIYDLIPEWGQTATDGQEREATIDVCGLNLTITFSGELITSVGCEDRPSPVLNLPVNDFDISPRIMGFNPEYDPDPNFGTNITITRQIPEGTMTIHDPKVVWLKDTPEADGPLIDQWPTGYSYVFGGIRYYPTIQIMGRSVMTVNIQTKENYWSEPFIGWHEYQRTVDHYLPLVGLHLAGLTDEQAAGEPLPLTSSYYNYKTGIDDSNVNDQWDFRNRTFRHKSRNPSLGFVQRHGASIAALEADVNLWNSDRTPYDPVLQVDSVTGTTTTTWETRQNALYFPIPCPSDNFAITVLYGGYVHYNWIYFPQSTTTQGHYSAWDLGEVREREIAEDVTTGVTQTTAAKLGAGVDTYLPEITAAVTTDQDGRPPDLDPNPVPVGGGGCRTTLGGTSSCDFDLPPMPDPPFPGDIIDFPDFPPMPVIDTNFPDFPNFPCNFPDLGNRFPCAGGGGGPGGHGPGGQKPGRPHIGTGGPFHGKRSRLFRKKRCYKNADAMHTIKQLCGELDINPDAVVFDYECDKTFTRCFRKGSSKFDAIWWIADLCGFEPFDPGDGTPTIGDPTCPKGRTWTFHEDIDLFELNRDYSGDGYDVVYAVEVWRARSVKNGIVVPAFSVISFTGTPFSTDTDNVKRIEVGPSINEAEAEVIARKEARKSRMLSYQLQVTVPYNPEYRLRNRAKIERPSKGFAETFMITGMESDLSDEGFLHILSLAVIHEDCD